MARGNSAWQTVEYLGLFPKMHDVKFRKHFGFDPSFFIGLDLSPSVGLLHNQGELHQAVTVEHRTSASYMSKSYGKTLHLFQVFPKQN